MIFRFQTVRALKEIRKSRVSSVGVPLTDQSRAQIEKEFKINLNINISYSLNAFAEWINNFQ